MTVTWRPAAFNGVYIRRHYVGVTRMSIQPLLGTTFEKGAVLLDKTEIKVCVCVCQSFILCADTKVSQVI